MSRYRPDGFRFSAHALWLGLALLPLPLQSQAIDGSGPPSAGYTLMFQEQFSGDEVNVDQWKYRTGVNLGGLNFPQNVRVQKGILEIDFRKEEVKGKAAYTGGGLISKPLFGYGYYEVESKLWGRGAGLHSSFWSMGTNDGDNVKTPKFNQVLEIDGYEVDSDSPSSIKVNLHYYIGRKYVEGGSEGIPKPNVDTSKDYFVMGYEWLPNQINWYVNGKRIRQVKNPKFYAPQSVWLTALATPKGFAGGPSVTDDKLPGMSAWRNFRYYARDLVGVNLLGNGSFEYNVQNSFEPDSRRDPHFPVAWIVDGDFEACSVLETGQASEGSCVLRQSGERPYQLTTRQALQYIKNGSYALTAMVRSSGGQSSAWLAVSGFGGETMAKDVASVGKAWQRVVIDDIAVTNHSAMIGIHSEGSGGQWIEIDDVVFAMKEGDKNRDWTPFPEDPAYTTTYPGEIVIDDSDSGQAYVETGSWINSRVSGYRKDSRASTDPNATAIWRPNIPTPGKYRVLFHHLAHSNNRKHVRVEVVYDGGTSIKDLDHYGLEKSWVTLGTFPFAKGPGSYVKLSALKESEGKESVGKYIRADTVRFIPVE